MPLFLKLNLSVLVLACAAMAVTNIVDHFYPPQRPPMGPIAEPEPASPPAQPIPRPESGPPGVCGGVECAVVGPCITCDWLATQVCPGQHCTDRCPDRTLCKAPNNLCLACPGGPRCVPGGGREPPTCPAE